MPCPCSVAYKASQEDSKVHLAVAAATAPSSNTSNRNAFGVLANPRDAVITTAPRDPVGAAASRLANTEVNRGGPRYRCTLSSRKDNDEDNEGDLAPFLRCRSYAVCKTPLSHPQSNSSLKDSCHNCSKYARPGLHKTGFKPRPASPASVKKEVEIDEKRTALLKEFLSA